MHPSLLKKGPLGAQGGYSVPKIDPKKVNFDIFGNKMYFFHIFHIFNIKTLFNGLLLL